MWETWVRSLSWEAPLEKGKATHSSILAWKIPWTHSPWGCKESDVTFTFTLGFPYSSVGKESACNAGHPGLTPMLGRYLGEGNGNSFQYSCLDNLMDRGAWQTTVYGVARVRHDSATKPPTTCMKCSLGSLYFLEEILPFLFCCFPPFCCIDSLGWLSYLSLLFFGTLHSNGYSLPFSLLLTSLLVPAICKASSDNHFAFLHLFSMGMVLIPVSCTMS